MSLHSLNCVILLSSGVYLTMRALLSPGDHVVVTFPGYQSLYEVKYGGGPPFRARVCVCGERGRGVTPERLPCRALEV